jgi:hypothetical protein
MFLFQVTSERFITSFIHYYYYLFIIIIIYY